MDAHLPFYRIWVPLELVTPQSGDWVMAAARRPEGGRTLSAVSINPNSNAGAEGSSRGGAIMKPLRIPTGGAVWAAGQRARVWSACRH